MPNYAFSCGSCGLEFQSFKPMDQASQPESCECGALADRIYDFQISERITAPRRVKPNTPPKQKTVYNNWEKGIATDHRGVPLEDEKGVIPIKRYAEKRHHYDTIAKKLDSSNVPAGKQTKPLAIASNK